MQIFKIEFLIFLRILTSFYRFFFLFEQFLQLKYFYLCRLRFKRILFYGRGNENKM